MREEIIVCLRKNKWGSIKFLTLMNIYRLDGANLPVEGTSGHPPFSLTAKTAVANSPTNRANPIGILIGFCHILSVSEQDNRFQTQTTNIVYRD